MVRVPVLPENHLLLRLAGDLPAAVGPDDEDRSWPGDLRRAKQREGARLVGIDVENIFAITFGIGIACLGAAMHAAADFLCRSLHRKIFVVIAFTVVVLGGMGSIVGALLGGFIIGITESVGGLLLGESLGQIGISLIFILILILKPTGLFGSKV